MHSVGRRQFMRHAVSSLGVASAFAMPWTIAAGTAVGSWDETVDPETADLIFRSKAPRNAEPKLGKLAESWVTPTTQFYIRSHGANPQIIPDQFRVSVAGLVEKPLELSVQQLIERFPAAACTCTVSCAGLRRYEFSKVKPVGGVQWEEGPIGNAVWSGVRLSDVLKSAGVKASARHVWFDGADEVRDGGHSFPFGGSVPLSKVMEDNADMPGVLLATHMNGQPLKADHGFPLRAIVPGYIGARSVKWLRRIVVSEAQSPNHFVADAYKIVRTGTPQEWDEAAPIYRYPVNAALCSSVTQEGRILLKGYALPSGDKNCSINRVEISTDSGNFWVEAALGDETGDYCWRLWSAAVTIADAAADVCIRATDSLGNTMPETVTWNPKGYLYNAWHRVPAKKLLN